MNDNGIDAASRVTVGHALVRSDPWRFEKADTQTRLFFELPDGDINGVPLFLNGSLAGLGHDSDAIDVIIAGTSGRHETIRAKLLPVDDHDGLFSAIFFPPAIGQPDIPADVKQQVLQHRISNGLAIIRSIFRRTAQASPDADSLVSHFLGRLDAFSRVQSNVVLYDTYGVALDELLLDEFMAHATRTGDRLTISGPQVRLKTRAAETLSLAIHELATNSVKFGALGSDDGHIDVKWDSVMAVNGGALLKVQWIESGVPNIDREPAHRGFGTDMIGNSMAFELAAQTNLEYTPDGLRLVIDIPISAQLLHEPISDG